MKSEINSMWGVNSFGNELIQNDIDNKSHRLAVGGLWDEIGRLQIEFLMEHGLKPHHKLLDIGCGCLRGGLHFIRYLDQGNYFGLDINSSLIKAGMLEIEESGLVEKYPKLVVDDHFDLSIFNENFEFIISVSLFTHLQMNMIIRCLCEVRKHLKPTGVYFTTFFQAPKSAFLDQLYHQPGGIVTNYDSDPFHYSFQELSWMANIAGLKVKLIGDWNHPRNQKMAAFSV